MRCCDDSHGFAATEFTQVPLHAKVPHGNQAELWMMQQKSEAPRRFRHSVTSPQSILPLKLLARDDAGGETPIDYESDAKIRIVLADSQAIYRVGVENIFALENDIQVIAQADTLLGLHDTIQSVPADIVVLEGNLIAGVVDTISELVQRAPKLRIVVQSAQNDRLNTVELYRRGVQGIIPRSISPGLLVKCVRKIIAGETWIDNQSVNAIIRACSSQTYAPSSLQHQPPLSPMELRLITCIARGMHNQEIAFHLGTSEQVVKNYLRKIYFKLGVLDRMELTLSFQQH